MTIELSSPLSFPDYEIGGETHRRIVAKLRGLPDTMPWEEIDRIRHEEQRIQFVTELGLPEGTTWKEIQQIETEDNEKRRAACAAEVEACRVITAVGLGLDEAASWKTINNAIAKPTLTKRLQISKLERLHEVTSAVHELQRLLFLPDTRTSLDLDRL